MFSDVNMTPKEWWEKLPNNWKEYFNNWLKNPKKIENKHIFKLLKIVEIDIPENLEDLSILEEFKNIKTIYIENVTEEKLEQLAKCKNLSALTIFRSTINSLEKIQEMEKLNILVLDKCIINGINFTKKPNIGFFKILNSRVNSLKGAEKLELKHYSSKNNIILMDNLENLLKI